MNRNNKIMWVIGIIAISALTVSVANAYNLGKLISGDIYGNTPIKAEDGRGPATAPAAPGPWECDESGDCTSPRTAGESMGELNAPYLSGENAQADFAGGKDESPQ